MIFFTNWGCSAKEVENLRLSHHGSKMIHPKLSDYEIKEICCFGQIYEASCYMYRVAAKHWAPLYEFVQVLNFLPFFENKIKAKNTRNLCFAPRTLVQCGKVQNTYLLNKSIPEMGVHYLVSTLDYLNSFIQILIGCKMHLSWYVPWITWCKQTRKQSFLTKFLLYLVVTEISSS